MLDQEEKKHVHTITFGGAKAIPRGMAKTTTNIAHRLDAIPYLSYLVDHCLVPALGLTAEKADIEFVGGLSDFNFNVLNFHANDNPDYMKAHIRRYEYLIQGRVGQ